MLWLTLLKKSVNISILRASLLLLFAFIMFACSYLNASNVSNQLPSIVIIKANATVLNRPDINKYASTLTNKQIIPNPY